jgi:hypothetical protein
MADKKRDILEFVEQSNFEQFTPTRFIYQNDSRFSGLLDFLQQWSEVVRVGVQLPHRDLDAVKRAEK